MKKYKDINFFSNFILKSEKDPSWVIRFIFEVVFIVVNLLLVEFMKSGEKYGDIRNIWGNFEV
jgi:hypothetical protein